MNLNIEQKNGIFYPIENNCPVVNAMLKNNIWEKKITKIFNDYVKEDWICIDVGTYIGLHSLTLSKLCDKVIGFEAQPLIYECLKNTLIIKNITNVKLYNIALSNKKGNTRIFTNNDGNASLEGIRDHKFKYNFNTNTDILDNYDIPKVDLIKIDIEGSEWEMLEGAVELITKHRPMIILETFRGKKNKNRLKEFCDKFNYSNEYISADNYLLKKN